MRKIRKVSVVYEASLLIEENKDRLILTNRRTIKHVEKERNATQAEIDLIDWDGEDEEVDFPILGEV